MIDSRKKALRTLFLGASFMLLTRTSVEAQRPLLRYTPSTPTVSPYNNLTRLNNSGLPNYYGIVRPQLQRNAEIRGLQLQQRKIENTVLQPVRQETTTVTGNQAQFQQYLHYYPEPPRIIR